MKHLCRNSHRWLKPSVLVWSTTRRPQECFADKEPDEIALYDRQIRLWGVKAQERQVAAPDRSSSIHLADSPQRLRTASVLVITMRALANEVVKNLVLAGIGSVTILDDHLVTEDDLGSQFLISDQHIGTNVRKLLTVAPKPISLNLMIARLGDLTTGQGFKPRNFPSS